MIAKGLPFLDYRHWHDTENAVNASSLVHSLKSWKEYRYRLDNPDEDDSKKRVGRGVHSVALHELTLAQFEAYYCIMPNYALSPENRTATGRPSTMRTTKYVQEQETAFLEEAEASGQEVLPRAEFEQVKHMVSAIQSHTLTDGLRGARALIDEARAEEHLELSVRANLCGVDCCGRVDGYIRADGTLFDLKTTANIDKWHFRHVVSKLNYLFRLHFYARLLEANDQPVNQIKLIVQEDRPPWDTAVVHVPKEAANNQQSRVDRLLYGLQVCRSERSWPGVDGGLEYELVINEWDMREDMLGD